jgi:multidrug efflux pump subunit AcrB
MNARDRESAHNSAPVPHSHAESPGEGGFNLSAWALRHQQLVIFLIGLATLFGVIGYTHLPQSEDPPFTFRTMVIQTYWPGATAREVQEQITDRIGRQLQAAPYIDNIKSYSRPGESMIFFAMKDSAPVKEVPVFRLRNCTTTLTSCAPSCCAYPVWQRSTTLATLTSTSSSRYRTRS